jgi:hypothetical protein
MYLFSRRRLVNPAQSRAAQAFALDIAQRVSQVVGQQIGTWASVHSQDIGTVHWTMSFPDLESVEASADKLVADQPSLDAIEQADGLFLGTYHDSLLQLVHGELDPNARPQYVTIVDGTARVGQLGAASLAAIEIAQHVSSITGQSLLVASNVTGTAGGFAWIGLSDSIGQLDRDRNALFADPGYVAFLDERAGVFEPGFGVSIYRSLS